MDEELQELIDNALRDATETHIETRFGHFDEGGILEGLNMDEETYELDEYDLSEYD